MKLNIKSETWNMEVAKGRAWLAAWKMVNDRNWMVVKADRKWNDDMGSSPTCTGRLSRQQTNHSLRKEPLAGCHWADNKHTHTHINRESFSRTQKTNISSSVLLIARRSDTFYIMSYIYAELRQPNMIWLCSANRNRNCNSSGQKTRGKRHHSIDCTLDDFDP